MKKRLFALLLALVMALGLTVTAWAEMVTVNISYLDEDGVLQTKRSNIDCKIINSINVPTSWDAGWYAVFDDETIDGNLDMNGEVHLILTDGCSLTVNGTLGAGTLTIYGQSGGSGKLTVTGKTPNDEFSEKVVRGISASDLTINGGIVVASTVSITDTGINVTTNNAETTSFGINAHNLTINGGNVTGKGGNGYTKSYGIYSASNTTINGGTVTGTGGNNTNKSYGVCSSDGNLALGGSARLTGIGGSADESYGVCIGISHGGKLQMTSDTLIAKATATGSNTAKAVKLKSSFTPPTDTYWWRTEENDAFTKSADAAYAYGSNEEATYTEITTVDPTPAVPDASAHGHTRRQPTTTTTEVAPDTTVTDTVTSAKTFDAGVAVYGVMAVSALLGMGYVGKKRV